LNQLRDSTERTDLLANPTAAFGRISLFASKAACFEGTYLFGFFVSLFFGDSLNHQKRRLGVQKSFIPLKSTRFAPALFGDSLQIDQGLRKQPKPAGISSAPISQRSFFHELVLLMVKIVAPSFIEGDCCFVGTCQQAGMPDATFYLRFNNGNAHLFLSV